jgi:hypothetical protein
VHFNLVGPGLHLAVELATEFEEPFSPCCSQDGKQILFIARKPKG